MYIVYNQRYNKQCIEMNSRWIDNKTQNRKDVQIQQAIGGGGQTTKPTERESRAQVQHACGKRGDDRGVISGEEGHDRPLPEEEDEGKGEGLWAEDEWC